LRCDYFPECHIASREVRDRRRLLRYRTLLVRQGTQTKNKLSALLMETGIPYNKQKLHHSKKYFDQLIQGELTGAVRKSETVTLRYPVVPVANGFLGGFVRVDCFELRKRNRHFSSLPADLHEHVVLAVILSGHT